MWNQNLGACNYCNFDSEKKMNKSLMIFPRPLHKKLKRKHATIFTLPFLSHQAIKLCHLETILAEVCVFFGWHGNKKKMVWKGFEPSSLRTKLEQVWKKLITNKLILFVLCFHKSLENHFSVFLFSSRRIKEENSEELDASSTVELPNPTVVMATQLMYGKNVFKNHKIQLTAFPKR